MDCKEYTVADIGRGRMSNMEFAKRMDRFGAGIFSKLAEIKKEKTAKGEEVIDLSIGAPEHTACAPHYGGIVQGSGRAL